MSVVNEVKVLLDISDDLQDNLLLQIENQVENHFKAYANVEVVEEKYNFIIVDVVIKRFNRLGAEGMKSQNIQGASSTYDYDDFKPYDNIINKLHNSVKGVKFV